MDAKELLSRYHEGERDFRQACLRRVQLQGADLSGANLHRAELASADLRKANLSQADLSEANLNTKNFQNTLYDKNTKWPKDFDITLITDSSKDDSMSGDIVSGTITQIGGVSEGAVYIGEGFLSSTAEPPPPDYNDRKNDFFEDEESKEG